MDNALKEINARFNCTGTRWRLGRCTYSDCEAVFKLHLQAVGDDGSLLDADYQRLLNCLADIGLEQKHLETIIECSFGRAKIVGLRRSGEKLILRAVDTGKKYLSPLSAIQKKLGIKPDALQPFGV